MFYLADNPYEVVVVRKARIRIFYNLKDSQLSICTDMRRGTWHMGGQQEKQ